MMLIRLSPAVLVFALGCSASAPGGSVNTASDSGDAANDDASSGASLATLCASICTGSGASCGAGCVQRCQAASALAAACADPYLAVLRCAAPNGYRCPSATMVTPPPAACSTQQTAFTTCLAASAP